jgi:DnaJ-class molecular chaperone
MAADPYETLGVSRDADEAAIRSAYRSLAKKHHPDLNPNKPEAADRFKTIASAYELLSDPEKRARFDRGEIDAEGQETPKARPFYRDFSAGSGREQYTEGGGASGVDPADLDDILAQAFGRARRGGAGMGAADFPIPGQDAHYALTVGFVEAATGVTRRLTLPDGKTLDVNIPAGTETGDVLRLRGQGGPGWNGGKPGDALIETTVAPHPHFRREGDDIVVRLPVTLKEAVLGTALTVPTIKGNVRVTIPAGSGDGTRLRLRGRGIRNGHQFVELDVIVPPGDEPELAAFLRDWMPRTKFNPRDDFDGGAS